MFNPIIFIKKRLKLDTRVKFRLRLSAAADASNSQFRNSRLKMGVKLSLRKHPEHNYLQTVIDALNHK